ncbi:hypothetical protein PISMIDRAFT_682705 [Pisolithus microcarpus 441]|uniref:Uncharacterized protein n=1 Tax=Pisolithus microcarpus 441 TaxID=765257 RepID=A0A0C9ZJ29_9AGAM|nr:hypothetical protein BKA83DRAFT_682705 [Pisolithus microcarpus]KIK19953.1 hypothetical protein PISMIDRAFT_682705 [Pisolithus microcarpus 441]
MPSPWRIYRGFRTWGLQGTEQRGFMIAKWLSESISLLKKYLIRLPDQSVYADRDARLLRAGFVPGLFRSPGEGSVQITFSFSLV